MDTRIYPPSVVRDTLSFLGTTTRWFGGARVILRRFDEWQTRWPANTLIRVLDVGTGGAELPIEMVRWARRRGRRIAVTALELVPDIAAVARDNAGAYSEITVRVADVAALERGGEQFDYVVASLLFHHIPPERSADTLRLFDRLSARGMIVSDLERSPAGLVAVSLLSHLIGNAVVRHDGPLSVRRAFRVEELTALAVETGLNYLTARSEPFFRVSLSGEKNA